MKYGFIIDNRKCIGCHACTTACKSEHEVPVGVFRTYVKQIEKGVFPHVRRLFSVLRCNQCTDAPCVEICPVEALYYRPDGIVDFDKDRCIGCKSCMQACPYDALYIDPETRTAAKCNYCAHRVDVGLEPACVNVCPEHAIISGDMDDPTTEIAELLAREQTTVRKPEKGTLPNVFYIEGDSFSLSPLATEKSSEYVSSEQTRGVGHFAKYTENMAYNGEDVINELLKKSGQVRDIAPNEDFAPQRSIEIITGKSARRSYNEPDKGILWGWEVPAYVTTKAISTGALLVPSLALALGLGNDFANIENLFAGLIVSLGFIIATTALLVKDLDQPKRFVYVLLRPQWRSWLVRGGYALTIFSGLLVLCIAAMLLGWDAIVNPALCLTAAVAVIVAVYTAYLFAQAKGRDFWQSPMAPLHMLVHAFLAGGAVFALLAAGGFLQNGDFFVKVMGWSTVANLVVVTLELTTNHPTADAKLTANMILKGRYKNRFWFRAICLGNLLPLFGLWVFSGNPIVLGTAGVLAIFGIYQIERIWIEAPQRIALS